MSLRSSLLKLFLAEVYPRLEKLGESAKGHPFFKETFWDEVKASYKGENASLKRHYTTLELPYGSSLSEVKHAYKTLMKRYHPDKFQDEKKKQAATELVKNFNESYAFLSRHLEKT